MRGSMRYLLPTCCLLGVLVTQAEATVSAKLLPRNGSTDISGNQLIALDSVFNSDVALLTKGAQSGFDGDFGPGAPGNLVMNNAGDPSTGLFLNAGGLSDDSIPPLCPGGLHPLNQTNYFAAATPAPLAAPCPMNAGQDYYVVTGVYRSATCIVGDFAVRNEGQANSDVSTPPVATDETRIRDNAAGAGNLVQMVTVPANLHVVVGTCCIGVGCLGDGLNAACCAATFPGAGLGQEDKLCSDPNPCACTEDSQCDDGLKCNGAETCNVAAGTCTPGTAPNCNDGNGCTVDSCSEAAPGNGCVNDAAAANGLACGSGADSECDNPDSCLGGSCASNNEPAGVACGDPSDTDCDNPDTCSGSGTCNINNAANGASCTDDGNSCTDDVCAAGACTHPNDDTNACDQGLNCTSNDHCVGGACVADATDCDDGATCTIDSCEEATGGCVNVDINAIPCVTGADCDAAGAPGATCTGGTCDCSENPSLELEPVKSTTYPGTNCHDEGDKVVVNIVVGATAPSQPVAGGQFFINYDPSCMDFNGFTVGDEGNGEAPDADPWDNVLYSNVDEVAGRIGLAVISDPNGGGFKGSSAGGVMATLSFIKIGECNCCDLCFTSENPEYTRLTNTKGGEIVPDLTTPCSKEICDNGDITATCPGNADVNSDCFGVTAEVTWPPVGYVDECDGALAKECTCIASDVPGAPEFNCDHLINSGGVFPQGVFEFSCDTVDDAANTCGDTEHCEWTVTVSDQQTLDVHIQLSPVVDNVPFTRCICFELFSSCSPLVVEEYCVTIDFGPPFNGAGQANDSVKIPKGKYVCIQARDRQHSLRSTEVDGLSCDISYSADFAGDPFFGGDWLIQGNLNRDRVIDILDFGTYLGQLNQNPNPEPKTCEDNDGDGFTHADLNGDGVVNIEDFTFIQINFLAHDKNDCCHEGVASDELEGITEISVKELREMGMADLAIADLNNDGLVNTADMTAYLQGARPKAAGKGTRGIGRVGSVR